MKKILAIILAISAGLFVSCTQEDKIETKPEVEVSKGLVFTATTEPTTKIALEKEGDTYNVLWRSGDMIAVRNYVYGTPPVGFYTTTSNTSHGDFTYHSGTELTTGSYYAFYPAEYWSKQNAAYPITQNYTPGVIKAPMFAYSTTTNLQFKNIGGLIRINLKTPLEGKKVKKIYLYSSAQSLSGTITNITSLKNNPTATVDQNSPAQHPVILECGNEGVEIGSDPTPFYFAVPANTYNELTICVITVDGIKQTYTLKSDKSIVVERSSIADITLTFDKNPEITDLSQKGTANTYIVYSSGYYKFKATVKGNGGLDPVTGTTATEINKNDISGVTVLWDLKQRGYGVHYDSKMQTHHIVYHDGYVYFYNNFAMQGNSYVAIFKDKEGGTAGVYDKGIDEILWSWLIWSTEEPSSVLYNGMVFMDRNIGSVTTGTFDDGGYTAGFSYQWGRPYPFASAYKKQYTPFNYVPGRTTIFDFPSFPSGTTVEYSVAHPTSFFQPPSGNWMSSAAFKNNMWSDDVKTIYDPCPVGWKVPSKAQLNGITSAITFYGAGFIGTCGSDFGYGNPGSVLLWSSTCDNYNTVWANAYGSITSTQVDVYFRSGMQIRPVEDESTHDLDVYTDLSETATANSYIVPSAGDYKFKATVRGNGASDLAGVSKNISQSEISTAELLWASYGTATAPANGELIRKIGYEDGYVFFSTGMTYKEGNAVIAVKNSSGNILWSWHLWFTDDNIEGSAQTYPAGAVFMDRNLGALAATDASGTSHYGLLYQWGRKDPFLNSKTTIGGDISSNTYWTPALLGTAQSVIQASSEAELPTVFAAAQSPNTFFYYTSKGWSSELSSTGKDLWAEDKTIFDPCPVGWKVPTSGHFDSNFRTAYINANIEADPLAVSTSTATVRFPNTGLKATRTVGYQYSSSGFQYYIRYAGFVVKPSDYHFRLWASDGVLIKDRTSLSGTEDHQGFFTYDNIYNGNPFITINNYTGSIYNTNIVNVPLVALGSGLSVRCVKESSTIVHPTGISLNKTSATLSEDQTLQLVASTIPANAAIPGITFSSSNPAVASVSETGLVTAYSPGSCTITATAVDNGITATCNITVSPASLTAVDLGLPSGTKWANINMGANSITGTGDLYKWGETVPNPSSTPYKWGTNILAPTKYNSEDGLTTLENADDAAYVNLGSRWHIPSEDDWTELKNYCNYQRVTKGSVKGCLFTSRNNGAQIFIPDGSYWTNILSYAPAYGRYDYPYASEYEFGSYYTSGSLYSKYRNQTLSIRAVYR